MDQSEYTHTERENTPAQKEENKMTTIERLEKKYGIKVRKDFFSWESSKQLYKMYSADGCPWENGLTLKGLREECKRWEKELLEIKQGVDEARARRAQA